jgi:hypothetical protein
MPAGGVWLEAGAASGPGNTKGPNMRKLVIAAALAATVALGGCTTGQGALVGGATGAAVGGLTTGTAGGAIVGAGVGAIAGAILVESSRGWCTYRYRGKLYRDRC